MLYTRTGDDGTTTLLEPNKRLSKDNPIYEALGTIDELNSWLGICRTQTSTVKSKINLADNLLFIQECLFIIQAELAGTNKFITSANLQELEEMIDKLEQEMISPSAFVIPGASYISANCDVARTITRRAERRVICVKDTVIVSQATLAYLNRISSYLYALARYSNKLEGAHELSPSYLNN